MTPADVSYHDVPGWPGYRVGADRSVWVNKTRTDLSSGIGPGWRRLKAFSAKGRGAAVKLRSEGHVCARSVELLLRAATAPLPERPRWIQRIGPPTGPSGPVGALELPADDPATSPASTVELRCIPGFPRYRVGADRSVWFFRRSNGTLRPKVELRTSSGRGYVALRHGGTSYALFVEDLVRRVFPELAAGAGHKPAAEYHPLPGWPGYRVGADRSVWIRVARPTLPPPWNRPRWRRLKAHSKKGRGTYVALHWEGRECLRSVELLLRAAFAPAAHHPGWRRRIGPPAPPAAAAAPPTPPSAAEPSAIAAAEALAPPVEYRAVPGFPRYRLGSDWSLWVCRTATDAPRPEMVHETTPGRPYAWLRVDGRRYRVMIEELARATFPERPWPPEDARSASIEYLPLPRFPHRVIGSDRSVWSLTQTAGRRRLGLPPFWRRLAVDRHSGRRPIIQLWRDGKQHASRVEDLAREAFACTFPRGPAHAETSARGSAHGRARLNEAKVAEARRLHAEGWNLEQLAERYGVVPHTMGYAVRGETWRHVPFPASSAKSCVSPRV